MKKALVILTAVVMMGLVGVIGYVKVTEYVYRNEYNDRVEKLYNDACEELWNMDNIKVVFSKIYKLENKELEGIICCEIIDEDGNIIDTVQITVANGYSYKIPDCARKAGK